MKNNEKEFILINDYLQRLGFSAEAISLYYALAKYGPQSIFQAAKLSNVERTKIYRLADELTESGLIEERLEYKRKFLKAADINSVKLLVDEEKQRVNELTTSFGAFSETLQAFNPKLPATEVLYYRGQEGIKQMLWNELSAKGESLCYVYKIFDSFVGPKFFEHWAEEFQLRDLKSREIRTEIFDQSYAECPNEMCFHMKNIKIRYLNSKKFPLTHGMSIYNNVVAIYNWWQDEVFGVEIYNPQVADLQRHFFEVFWKMARGGKGHHEHNAVVKRY